jgi:hypothetical protein
MLLLSKQDQIGALLGCILCKCGVNRYAVNTKYMDSRFFVKFLLPLGFYCLLILLLGFVKLASIMAENSPGFASSVTETQ